KDLAAKLPAHAHPRGRGETVGGLVVSNGPQPGTDFAFDEVSEPQVSIQGRVPGDVSERRERDARQPRVRPPDAHPLDKRPADADALMIGPNTDLLDVRTPVYDVREHIPDGRICGIGGHPKAAGRRLAV